MTSSMVRVFRVGLMEISMKASTELAERMGKGIFSWTNGRSYMGEYRNDQKEGYGWFKWPDGSQYEGEWRDGKQHGSGTFLSGLGEKTSGEWEAGRRVKDAVGNAAASPTGSPLTEPAQTVTGNPVASDPAPTIIAAPQLGEASSIEAAIPDPAATIA